MIEKKENYFIQAKRTIFELSGYYLRGVQPRPLMDRSVCNDACKMHAGMGPRIPTCTCTVKVFDVCACACALLVRLTR